MAVTTYVNFNPNEPIPNDPFFYPRTNYLQGPLGPLIIGSGLEVTVDGSLIATATGSGTVTQVNTGSGLTGGPITTAGTISLDVSGVTAGSYTYPALTVDTYGRITNIASQSPVLSVSGSAPVVSSGGDNPIIGLATSGVTPGSYTLSSITVDQFGRVTAASDGSAPGSITAVTATAPLASSGGSAPDISLTDSGVAPGSYAYPTLTVTAKGIVSNISAGVSPVTSVSASSPVVSSGGTTPVISLESSGVVPGSYTFSSITVDALGRLTSASSGVTPVTSVTAGAGLTGGTITSTGTIALATTTVTPGSYTNSSFTVDGYGRVTAASSGAAPVTSVTANAPLTQSGMADAPVLGVQVASTGQLGVVQVGSNIGVDAGGVISVASASTTAAGIVQLNDSVTSNSTTEALTANQGLALQAQIDSLSLATNLTFAGTFDAATGLMLTVTSSGSGQGFTVGQALPAASGALTDFFVIATTPGSYSPPPGTSGPYTVSQGDWFLCNGSVWQFVNVGTDLPIATTGTAGIVELATDAETQTGTDATRTVTPAGAAATYIPLTALTGKGALISANAANSFETISVGSNGDFLTADNTTASGLKWVTLALDYIPDNTFTAAGQIITGTGTGAYTALAPGANGKFLTTNAACLGGLEWVTPDYIQPSAFTSKGALLTALSAGDLSVLSVGGDGEVLTACSTALNGLCWASASVPAIPCSVLNAKGTLITTCTPSTPAALPVGTDGYVLTACSADDTGLCWAAPSADVPCAAYTALGDILAGCGVGLYEALPLGNDGEVLTACSTASNGLCWAPAVTASIPCSVLLNRGDLIVASGASTPAALSVGSDGQFLVACAAATDGVCWITTCDIPTSAITGKGALITGSAAGTPVALPVGTNGFILSACSDTSSGLCWESLPNLAAATPTVRGTVYGCTSPNGTYTGLGCFVNCGAGTAGDYATFLGYKSGVFNTQGCDTAVGSFAIGGTVATGGNTALGYAAIKGSGGFNTAVGHRAMQASCSSSVGNVAIGACAGVSITLGDNNTAVGYNAGRCISSGSSNTFVGCGAGRTITSGSLNTFVGFGLPGSSASLSCFTMIGSCSRYASFSIFSSNWSFTSDERLKTDITALPVSGEGFVNSLRPVEFTWLDKETRKPIEDSNHCVVGFVAQEVQKSLNEAGLGHVTNLVSEDAEGYLSMEHTALIPFLVKAVQELSAKVAELENKV